MYASVAGRPDSKALPSAQSFDALFPLLDEIAHTYGALERDVDSRVDERTSELKQASDSYRSMFENATDGIFQTTADGHYLNCNPALARIYGYDSPEELKASVSDIKCQLYVDDETRPRFIQLMARSRPRQRI